MDPGLGSGGRRSLVDPGWDPSCGRGTGRDGQGGWGQAGMAGMGGDWQGQSHEVGRVG